LYPYPLLAPPYLLTLIPSSTPLTLFILSVTAHPHPPTPNLPASPPPTYYRLSLNHSQAFLLPPPTPPLSAFFHHTSSNSLEPPSFSFTLSYPLLCFPPPHPPCLSLPFIHPRSSPLPPISDHAPPLSSSFFPVFPFSCLPSPPLPNTVTLLPASLSLSPHYTTHSSFLILLSRFFHTSPLPTHFTSVLSPLLPPLPRYFEVGQPTKSSKGCFIPPVPFPRHSRS